MGVDAWAEAQCESNQAALEHELAFHGLHSNLRYCHLDKWKSTLEQCTGQSINNLEWSTVNSDYVVDWATMAIEHAKAQPINEDVTKLSMYLSICAKYKASIVFC